MALISMKKFGYCVSSLPGFPGTSGLEWTTLQSSPEYRSRNITRQLWNGYECHPCNLSSLTCGWCTPSLEGLVIFKIWELLVKWPWLIHHTFVWCLLGTFFFNPRKIQQFSEVASVACCLFAQYSKRSGNEVTFSGNEVTWSLTVVEWPVYDEFSHVTATNDVECSVHHNFNIT